MSFKISCPHCKRALNVTEPAFGKTVPCPGCKQPIKVPHLTAGPSNAPVERAAPPSMPPVVDGLTTGSDPLDFLSAAPGPSLPPAMPPLPAGDHASTPDEADVLLARYRSQVKPRGEEIGKRIAQGADAVKKRARALEDLDMR